MVIGTCFLCSTDCNSDHEQDLEHAPSIIERLLKPALITNFDGRGKFRNLNYCTGCTGKLSEVDDIIKQLDQLEQQLQVIRSEIIGHIYTNYGQQLSNPGRVSVNHENRELDNWKPQVVNQLMRDMNRNLTEDLVQNFKTEYRQSAQISLLRLTRRARLAHVKLHRLEDVDWFPVQFVGSRPPGDIKVENVDTYTYTGSANQEEDHDQIPEINYSDDLDSDHVEVGQVDVDVVVDIDQKLNLNPSAYAYACDKCDRKFTRPIYLRNHRTSHPELRLELDSATDGFRCKNSMCSFVGTEEAQLLLHVRLEHKGSNDLVRPFICASCGADYTRGHRLRIHERALHGETTTRAWKCAEAGCTIELPTQKRLWLHMEQVHNHLNGQVQVQGPAGLRPRNRNQCKCHLCDKVFRNAATLEYHVNAHLNLTPYSCHVNECDRQFSSPIYLRNHQTTHPGLKVQVIPCPDCEKTFTHLQHLQIHRQVHLNLDPTPIKGKMKMSRLKSSLLDKLSCKYASCQFKPDDEAQLVSHVSLEHSGCDNLLKPHICRKCGANYTRSLSLRNHEMSIHGEVSLSAPYLKPQPRLPKESESESASSKSKSCPNPNPITKTKGKKRIPKHRKCPQCDKILTTKLALAIHLNGHANIRPYMCEVCSATFTRRQYLRHHQTKHPELQMRAFRCPDCDKTFSNPSYLRVHRLVLHGSGHKYTCEVCGFKSYYESGLRSHMDTVHIKEKKHACDVCDLKFFTTSQLKIHQRNHTGERPFSCTTCEAAFTSKNGLNRHVKIHSEVPAHSCPHCGKKFAVMEYVRIHMKSHCSVKKAQENAGTLTHPIKS